MRARVPISVLIAAFATAPARAERRTVTGPAAEPDPLAQARKVTGRERPHFVAFTFDDGPSHRTTPAIMDTLERFGVPGTFFVVGRRFVGGKENAVKNARVLADLVTRGHLVGNHTFRHDDLRSGDCKAVRATVVRNGDAIAAHLGRRPALFRAPYGRSSRKASAVISSLGYTEVNWSVDPQDFRPSRRKSLRTRVVREILAENGGVVLLHDTKPWTARALPHILADLQAENCRRRLAGQRLVVPVSLHYFLRERDGSPRPVPPDVEARTRRYLNQLDERCAGGGAPVDKARMSK
jgi:peptidoglycan/xylan/chitin deacetylase (PgdA/CDA1 family)